MDAGQRKGDLTKQRRNNLAVNAWRLTLKTLSDLTSKSEMGKRGLRKKGRRRGTEASETSRYAGGKKSVARA